MKLIKVEPTETKKVTGFQSGPDGCGVATWDAPIYPKTPNGDRLREVRMEPYRNLREAGKLVGLSPEQISGLEWGRYTLSDEDWRELFAKLK